MMNDLKQRLTIASREKKLRDFYREFREGMTVLDVGFTNEYQRQVPSTTNYFLKNFRFNYQFYTGLSIETAEGMAKVYPRATFVTYDGIDFPFADRQFDWVFCNAVIEHVTGIKERVHFLEEMLRVSRNVFFTTPNKFFPVELHSSVVFLHWCDPLFYRYVDALRVSGCSRTNLRLLSRRDIRNLMKEVTAREYEVLSNKLLFYPMTFTVICRE